MPDRNTEKAFLEAAEIAKKLPKNLQETAFNRALDHLLGRAAKKETRGATEDTRDSGERTRESELLASIDRTKHPDIGVTDRVADRALKVLHLANEDYGVDGLTAQTISAILTQKFRLPVTANAVNTALDRETDTVNVRQEGGVKTFHIMAPGEEYLRRLRSGEVGGQRRRVRKAALIRARKKSGDERPGKAVKAEGTARKKHTRPGPKAAVSNLVGGGFFTSPRTISAVQDELKHSRGHTYSLQELAPALVRSLRDGALSRTRNAQGQYEYSEA